jgi:predicted Zn-dependent protease
MFLVALALAGCATNPVTGDRELSLVGEEWERSIGKENYAPLRQAQGGDLSLEPAVVDYVQRVGQRVAAEADRDLPYAFTVINNSVPNAWALPGGKIAVNRGLLTEMDSEAELAAVLGHEVIHAAARHGAQRQSRQVLLQGAIMAGGLAVGASTDRSEYTAVAILAGGLGAQLISARYSREAEREADRFGMIYMDRAGYDPAAAVELQKTFVRLSKESGGSKGFAQGLFASHPPSQERVDNNKRILRKLDGGGEWGRARYQELTAVLERLEPAYAAYDAGREALRNEKLDKARRKAREALAIESGEAIFHALLGDVRATADELEAAEAAYTDALARDDSWFYHHLRRGMVRESRGKLAGARQDLQRSLEMLPTAAGHYYLGNAERDLGNRQAAIENYRKAAQSDSEAGRRAREALAEMDAAG